MASISHLQPTSGARQKAARRCRAIEAGRWLGLAFLVLSCRATPARVYPTIPSDEPPLIAIEEVAPSIVIDLRYATPRNFTGQILYGAPRALLRAPVARRLARVQDALRVRGVGLKVLDAYRPHSAQVRMWELVPNGDYVADPRRGSRHNRGAAVDVTLVNSAGQELEMPSGYDDFTPAAHRGAPGASSIARANSELLERHMRAEGFEGLPTEWWHFDAVEWREYSLLDISLENAQ
ncbi:MAG: M15 family metallopeptidase [Planctomycetota bacterium]